MSRHARIVLFVVLALAIAQAPGWAQENPSAPEPSKSEPAKAEAKSERPAPRPDRGLTASLRVQLVISRSQGEKRTGSLPYVFTVVAGGDRVRMRMGLETPIPVTPFSVDPEGLKRPSGPISYQYRNVGTNIDCTARDLADGRYRLNLNVENSSALAGAERGAEAVSGPPVFRKFEMFLDPILRDGQTIQAVASTDPVTGEVVKIDVTLNVVK